MLWALHPLCMLSVLPTSSNSQYRKHIRPPLPAIFYLSDNNLTSWAEISN